METQLANSAVCLDAPSCAGITGEPQIPSLPNKVLLTPGGPIWTPPKELSKVKDSPGMRGSLP